MSKRVFRDANRPKKIIPEIFLLNILTNKPSKIIEVQADQQMLE
jgi:hypothetical protein